MGFNHSVQVSFFLLIVITGVITTITDLCHKKIRNNHLIIIAVVAVIFAIFKGFLDPSLPALQLMSTICAVIIAWIFFKNNLWRGGDAKLFVLYAFIIGLIFLGVLWTKIFLTNPKSITENFFMGRTSRTITDAALRTFCVSWILLPLLFLCGLTKYGVLSFLSVYIINFSLRKQIGDLIAHKTFVIMVFMVGLFLRYQFLPGFFLWHNLLFYLITLSVYTIFSIILYKETLYIAESKDRIPFSPFLFLGCLVSYTPFLWRIMSFQRHLG